MKFIKWLSPLLIAATLALGAVAPLPAPPVQAAEHQGNEYQAVVAAVVGGDTIKLTEPIAGLGSQSRNVRMLGIDTPETNYQGKSQGPHAVAAKQELARSVKAGDHVTLITHPLEETDKYGRLLAHVLLNGKNINQHMLETGHAVTYFIWPNMMFFEDYSQAVKSAQDAGLGIWNPNDPLQELPFVFRSNTGGTRLSKFVGNYATKKYVSPKNYASVPVHERVFFSSQSAARKAGYSR